MNGYANALSATAITPMIGTHGHSSSHEDNNVSSGGLSAADRSSSDDSRCQEEASWAQMRTVSKTKLPDGRLSLLADIGSRINIVGCNTEREFSQKAEQFGHKTTYERRKHRLNVNGVGLRS